MKNVSDISPRYVGTEELAVRTTTVPEVALNDATVLVVEDNGDVREYIVSTLARLGYRALEAGEASAALTVIEHHPEVNLLLTDVGLPGLNGRRLAEEASRRLPGRVSAPRRHPAPKVAQVVERAN